MKKITVVIFQKPDRFGRLAEYYPCDPSYTETQIVVKDKFDKEYVFLREDVNTIFFACVDTSKGIGWGHPFMPELKCPTHEG